MPDLSISIVSHLQSSLINDLLRDLKKHCAEQSLEVLLTLNLPEPLPEELADWPFPLKVIRNPQPLGFGANHNQAFRQASGMHFCVLNPDIRLRDNPFPALLTALNNPAVWLVAPLVLNPVGLPEDSARRFPTPLKILCKVFGGCQGSDYVLGTQLVRPDWVGGMFMLFPSACFSKLGGFDERYFMYYEDVDLCARLRLRAGDIVMTSESVVVHHAQRGSHRNLKYLRWHLQSMTRFFLSPAFWQWQCRNVMWRK